MSDRVVHPSLDKGKQPMQYHKRSQSFPKQSAENCNTAVQVETDLSLGPAKQLEKVVGCKILHNIQAMGSSATNEMHGRPGSVDSLTLNLSHGSGSNSMSKHDIESNRSGTLLSLAPPSAETSYTDFHIKHQSISQYPQGPVNSQMVFGNSFSFLPPNFGGTTSHNLYPSGTIAAAPPFLCSIQENVNRVTSIMSSERNLLDAKIMAVLEHEKCRYQSQSKVVAHAKYIGNAVASNHHPPVFYGGQYRTMHNHSGNVFVSNHHPPVLTEEHHKTMLNHSGINMFQSRDAFMMRLRTSVENFEPSLIANDVFAHNHHPPAFSEEQHKRMHDAKACTSTKRMRNCAEKTSNLRITKSTDSKESPNSRGSKVLSPVKKNSPTKCYSFPQVISHSDKGVELQVISSSDSEGKDDVQEIKAIASKKKSLAKTDRTDKHKIKKNHLSGVGSSSAKKNTMADTHMPNKDAITSAGEKVGQKRKLPNPEIPDMNIELSAEPDDTSRVDNPDPSSSRTRSLDMYLLHHPEQYGPDATSRWIKHFKINDSCNQSIGTKSLSLGEATSSEKVNQISGKTKEGEIINSGPGPKSTGKELMVLDQKITPIRLGDPSSMNNVDKSDVTARSQSWTRRWHHNPAKTPEKKPEAIVVSDPESSKVKPDKVEEKPFASFAAMALMGRVISGFHRCQFIN